MRIAFLNTAMLFDAFIAAIVAIIFIGNTQDNVEIFDLHVAANCLAMPLRFCDIYEGHMIKLVYIPDALAFGRIDNTLSCQSNTNLIILIS